MCVYVGWCESQWVVISGDDNAHVDIMCVDAQQRTRGIAYNSHTFARTVSESISQFV